MPVWLPDGSGVLFASDRAGSLGLWKIAVAGGQPVGAPVLVRPRIGKYRVLGFDGSGDLYYWVSDPIEVYTADVDLGRGGVTGVKRLGKCRGRQFFRRLVAGRSRARLCLAAR